MNKNQNKNGVNKYIPMNKNQNKNGVNKYSDYVTNWINKVKIRENFNLGTVENQKYSKNIGMASLVDVGIPCALGCEELVYINMYTMLKTAKYPDRLNFIIGIDIHSEPESGYSSRARETKIRSLTNKVIIFPVTTGFPRSSISHAIVLNKIFEKFTSPYGLISDADVATLKQNWDDILLPTLTDKIVIAGIPYGDAYHYQKFPCATFIIFKTPILKQLQINFIPEGHHDPKPMPLLKPTKEESLIYNVSMDTPFRKDTGSELCWKIRKAGYESITLSYGGGPKISKKKVKNPATGKKHVIVSLKKATTPFLKLVEGMPGIEFHYQGEPFFTHCDNSSKLIKQRDHPDNPLNMWTNGIVIWFKQQLGIDASELNELFIVNTRIK